MATGARPFHVLIIAADAHDAETVLRRLHHARLPARGMFTQRPKRLPQLVAEHHCDLVVALLSDACHADEIADGYRKLGADVPLLVLHDAQARAEHLLTLLRAGAGLVDTDDDDALAAAVRRQSEVRGLSARVEKLGAQADGARRALRQFAMRSREPIAYLCGGLVADVNPTFIRLFSAPNGGWFSERMLTELVSAEHREVVEARLGSISATELDDADLRPVQFIGAHGQAFVRRLVLQPTGVEGDDCCYVVLRTEAPDGTDSEPPAAAPATVRPGHAAMLQRLTALLDRAGAEEQPPAVGVIVMEDLAGLRRTEGFGRAAELADDLGRTLPDAVPEGVEVFRIADDAFALIVEEGLARDDRQLREEIDRAVKEATGADANPPRCRVGLAVAAPAALEAPETLDLAFADALTRTLPRNSDAVDSLRHTPTRETLPHEPVAADPPRADDSTSAADADGDETPADSLSLEYKIEQALSQDGFNIMFQPIISLLGDTQENYSVLLRLEDINRLILTAAELLGPAARSGNLPEIDRWVVARALRDLSARRKAGQRIGFFLSLSAETIKDPGLLIWICDMLREHDARGRWVIFQLQERDANAQADHWAPLADGLKRIKSRIAINQFGHEPHPDRLLERVPPDFVKFAPDFAFGLADDAAKQKRLADLARLARAYGAKTIVTGVEDARALSVLWSTGIDYVQGNFLQGPSPSLDAPS